MRVRIEATTNSFHLANVYTGLSVLARSGRIELEQTCRRLQQYNPRAPQHLRRASATRVQLFVEEPGREAALSFDCFDGQEIDRHLAERSTLYLKRSYRREAIPEHLRDRVRPLGMTFAAYPDFSDRLLAERFLKLDDGMSRVTRMLAALRGDVFPPISLFRGKPQPDLEPRAIFMVRAWDPTDQAERAPEKVAEREAINEGRARAIRELRRRFGERFTGGFAQTRFARIRYPDLLVPDPRLTVQKTYLQLLREYPVCVATIGLHNSIGFKMGEYTALAKAIVTEPLYFDVPGPFQEGVNYLRFNSPDELVEAVGLLFDDRNRRGEQMEANASYASQYIYPEAMVERALQQATTAAAAA